MQLSVLYDGHSNDALYFLALNLGLLNLITEINDKKYQWAILGLNQMLTFYANKNICLTPAMIRTILNNSLFSQM